MTKEKLLTDFKEFLQEYREAWNSCDPEKMTAHFSKDLQTRWADPNTNVSDSNYEQSKDGWRQAYDYYRGKQPKWHFENVLTEINTLNQGVAVFWVTFEMEGKFFDQKKLFVETFQKENSEWKKIREYAKYRVIEPEKMGSFILARNETKVVWIFKQLKDG